MTEELEQRANLFASIMSWNEEEDTWEDIAERAYIAGAIENSIQWHDLRKDPNDLPKKEGCYLVKVDDCKNDIYETDNFYLDDYCFVLYGKYVIAWCEIPQFKE